MSAINGVSGPMPASSEFTAQSSPSKTASVAKKIFTSDRMFKVAAALAVTATAVGVAFALATPVGWIAVAGAAAFVGFYIFESVIQAKLSSQVVPSRQVIQDLEVQDFYAQIKNQTFANQEAFEVFVKELNKEAREHISKIDAEQTLDLTYQKHLLKNQKEKQNLLKYINSPGFLSTIFVDGQQFETAQALFDHLKGITDEEKALQLMNLLQVETLIPVQFQLNEQLMRMDIDLYYKDLANHTFELSTNGETFEVTAKTSYEAEQSLRAEESTEIIEPIVKKLAQFDVSETITVPKIGDQIEEIQCEIKKS